MATTANMPPTGGPTTKAAAAGGATSPVEPEEEEGLTTLTDLHKLEERYPFDDAELEVLVRCHDHLKQSGREDFLLQLARASPYSHYFLPGDEMSARIEWIENHILPPGFANELRAAISCDAFVEYANQHHSDHDLERFIEGVADTGRRGPKEALRVLYNLVGGEYAKISDIIDVSLRMALSAEALTEPNLDRKAMLNRMQGLDDIVDAMSQTFLKTLGDPDKGFKLRQLIQWAEPTFPMLSAPLSTFVHHLVFHGHPYPASRIPYVSPNLDYPSDVFDNTSKPLSLMALSFACPLLGGKWHRLYSSESDGRSFNRLEWSLLGYGGPTVLVVKTTCNAILGAFISVPWKQSKDFYGNQDFFLFQLQPRVDVFHTTGKADGTNYMYVHTHEVHGPYSEATEGGVKPHGIGFGGCYGNPRLFIPESFEHCSGQSLDHTYESGNLLPVDSLEKFDIAALEVWGVGGDDIVSTALRMRDEHREVADTVVRESQKVHDKHFIATDMQSGLIENRLFTDHEDQTRGRQDFVVDDVHGGYKIEEQK